ncbi:MAG: helix-turn-helix domain-containing protein, partial [Myxococcota bacterium]
PPDGPSDDAEAASEREASRRDIETAFRVLSDPDQRARFDAQMAKGADTSGTSTSRSARQTRSRGRPDDDKAPLQELSRAEASASTDASVSMPDASPSGAETPRLALRFLPPLHEGESLSAPLEKSALPASIEARSGKDDADVTGGDEELVTELPRHLSILPQEAAPLPIPSIDEIDGTVVRRLRQERGLSLEVLAAHTHIGKAYLQAIEDNAVDELPARVYLRGFLTQVARVLRVDRRLLADGYLRFVERNRTSPGT